MANIKACMSSKKMDWETPQDFFDELDKEFHFVLDVCADGENKKCQNYFSKKNDALKQDWNLISKLIGNGWKWMNPPYGREIGSWVKKASEERKVVALLPARTDTKYFHEFIYKKKNTKIRFIKGRLKFSGSKSSAPFPSMIVIFR